MRGLKLPEKGKIHVHFHRKKKLRMPVCQTETKTHRHLTFTRYFAKPVVALICRSVAMLLVLCAPSVGWPLLVREAFLLVQEVMNVHSAWVAWRALKNPGRRKEGAVVRLR